MNYTVGLLMVLALVSCDAILDQDETDFGTGSNTVGFESGFTTLKAVADGQTVSSGIPIIIQGPSVSKLKGDVTVLVNLDPSSTAIEGVHYTLDSNNIVLSPSSSSLSPSGAGVRLEGTLPVTIITAGIQPPLDTPPVLNFTITGISSSENVVLNDLTQQV